MNYLTLKAIDREDQKYYHTMELFERLNDIPNIREELCIALKTAPMENWGRWLGVKKTIIIHELESYIVGSEWDKFSKGNGNTEIPLNSKNDIHAQINLQKFDKGGADYEHRLEVTFFTNNN
jgi:hypothetical protein